MSENRENMTDQSSSHNKKGVELLWSKFKRSTQKLSSMSTDFDLDLKVNIEDQALGGQKMNWVFRLTLFNAF